MNKSFITVLKPALLYTIICFSILQLIFHFSAENLFCVLFSLIGWIITDNFIINEYNFKFFTLSTSLIFGYSLTQFFLPLVFIFIEGKPLIFNLDVPVQVFVHSFLGLLVFVLVHSYYKNISSVNKFVKKVKWQKNLAVFHLYKIPTNRQLWLMGFVGIGVTLLSVFLFATLSSKESEDNNVISKFLIGFQPFIAAPYYIFIKRMYDTKHNTVKIKRIFFIQILVYSAMVVGTGILVNTRALFMSSFTALFIAYSIGLYSQVYDYRVIKFKIVGAIALFAFFAMSILSDVGTAMIAVRSQRAKISAEVLLKETIAAYKDKELLKSTKLDLKRGFDISGWDEYYYDNPFLARLSNIKFNDLSLSNYNKIGTTSPEMQDYAFKKFIILFPTPLIRIFDKNFDKTDYTQTSFGDRIFYAATGYKYALGGVRTGHFAGVGMAVFGWGYLVVLGIGMYFLFFLLDLFVLNYYNENVKYKNIPQISLAGLIPITTIFLFFANSTPSESVTNIFTYMLRSWTQLIALYAILFYGTRFFK